MKLLYKITKDVSVGIWDDAKYVVRVYKDEIIVTSPYLTYVKWENNTGSLAYRKKSIRNQNIINRVISDIKDDCVDSAWHLIGRTIRDEYLINRIPVP